MRKHSEAQAQHVAVGGVVDRGDADQSIMHAEAADTVRFEEMLIGTSGSSRLRLSR